MKPIFQTILIVFFAPLLFSSPAVANDAVDPEPSISQSGLKLLSGMANVATGWLELPKNINLAGQHQNAPASGVMAIGLGVLQGTWYAVNRTGCGLFDMLTFMFPTRPSVDPVFVWDGFLRESKFMGY